MITCPICDYHFSANRNHCPICGADETSGHPLSFLQRANGAELQRTSGKSDANCSNRHERLQVNDWFALDA